jgi:type II secretory pathway pseudopilin PulG
LIELNEEPQMSIALLVVIGIALVAAGVGVTFTLASVLPQAMLQRAQNNGRYAGLTADDQGGSTGKQVTSGAPKLGHRTINAI